MSLRIGIVGLPNAGKSTLLNALAQAGAATASYPFTTIEPNRAVVAVPDDRLEAVARVMRPERIVPATVEFVDIAGLVRGASGGEGLGNQFLAHIRESDVLVHVVRVFEAPGVPHVESRVDPSADAEIVEAELALADLTTLERVRERIGPRARSGDKAAREELALADRLVSALQRGIPARRVFPEEGAAGQTADGPPWHEWRLLTAKPVVYVANVGEGAGTDHAGARALLRHAGEQEAPVVAVAAGLEAELADLSPAEAEEFRRAAGIEAGLPRLVRTAYELLGLVTFFSIASAEVRAWPVREGTTAVEAAGDIHTDMARGFIRAEVVSWTALVEAGSIQRARESGTARLEGKGYRVQDGDVITFRFAA